MNKLCIALLLNLLFLSPLFSQEMVFDIANPQLKFHSKNFDFNKKSRNDTILELPFFDDFAGSTIYPDQILWTDYYAFINSSFAIDPISINNATLDAVDQYGEIYPNLIHAIPIKADELTSNKINLDYAISDSIYLSFYYQAGGKGNTPEYEDSLVLQFKTPDTNWTSVWNVPGGQNMDYFKNVIIPINDEKWLKDEFQFRFLNYVSLSSHYEPSWASNVDHWHLDFVFLDKDRAYNDTIPEDVAFIYNFTSFINKFESVPKPHFEGEIATNILKDSITFIYKSYYDDSLTVGRNAIINDLSGNQLPDTVLENDKENISKLQTITYTRSLDYSFYTGAVDSAIFEVIGIIEIEGQEVPNYLRNNDTVKYYQKFYNYYAYDDGTPEKGYGLSGQGSAYSSLAIKYEPLEADTLIGVYVYFNSTLNAENENYFFLTVWEHQTDTLGGYPGDTIYQQIGDKVEFSNNLHGFVYYELNNPIYIDTTFYIGWVKTNDDMLNIGLDINRIATENVFYNVSGEWQQSSVEGALMIRPAFGKSREPSKITEKKIHEFSVDIYPNPAKDILHISTDTEFDYIEIYNNSGKIVIRENFTTQIPLHNLPNGIYYVRFFDNDLYFTPQKLIITK